MSFSDLLKKPLPSKMNNEEVATESAEEVETLAMEGENTVQDVVDEFKTVDVKVEDSDDTEDVVDVQADLDDIDLSDLSDEELDQMEDELRDSDLDDVVGDVEPVELTAEEEREADDLMSIAGTTELIRSELSADEQEKFLESARETQIAVFEGFLLESDVTALAENDDVVTEAHKFYTKTRVLFSKEDRKAQLYAVALNVSARAHNDPDYIKLQKVQKIRRILKRKIQKKYHAEALRRMRVYFNRLRNSKSTVLSNLGKKVDDSSKED